MLAASLVTPAVIDKVATSEQPWIYLALIFMGVIGVIARKIYTDMKKEKADANLASEAREQRLIEIDEEHRKDSKERENRLQDQIKETTEAFKEITTVVNDSFDRITAVVNKISDSQEKIIETQQETVESVRHLNNDFREIKSRIEQIERDKVKESA